MNRRGFLKLMGIVPVVPGILASGGIVKVKQFNMFGITSKAEAERISKFLLMQRLHHNPVAILHHLICANVPSLDMVDHASFEKAILKCDVLIDPKDIPQESVIKGLSFLAVKSKNVVWWSHKEKSCIKIIPEWDAQKEFDLKGILI